MSLLHWNYFSDALGRQTAAYVIYPDKGVGPFATLYLLHGLSDDHTIWLRRTSLERYVDGLPLIVVMPDGARSFYCDAVEGFAHGTAIARELVDKVDAMLPTRKDAEHRFVAGLSMGGYGALRLALAYPDRFGAAVSHSGALAFGHTKTSHRGEPLSPEFQRVVGENPEGTDSDLWALAKKCQAANTLPRLRIDCGVDDFLIESNREFAGFLTSAGIAHEYEEFAGEHNWAYWDEHIRGALKFLMPE